MLLCGINTECDRADGGWADSGEGLWVGAGTHCNEWPENFLNQPGTCIYISVALLLSWTCKINQQDLRDLNIMVCF